MPERTFRRSSRDRLTPRHLARFPGENLFARVARTLCEASCLPRKELFEAWEVARRVHRRLPRGPVLELCAGHGLLAHLLVLLGRAESARCVDRTRPLSASRVADAMTARFPQLAGRVDYVEGDLAAIAVDPNDVVVSVHACGVLTDRVLDRAIDAGAAVAVMPCCHALDRCDDGGLAGWLPGPVAVDAARVAKLRQAGYSVHTQTIPDDITPENRLLIATR